MREIHICMGMANLSRLGLRKRRRRSALPAQSMTASFATNAPANLSRLGLRWQAQRDTAFERTFMKIFYFSTICLALACLQSPAFGAESNAPAAPVVRTNSAIVPWPHSPADVQRKLAKYGGKHADIVFEGDSISNRWETTGRAVWAERFAAIAADFGIEGDRTEHVLNRLAQGQLDGIDPKVVVLMIGTNNQGQNTAEEIAEGIKRIIAEYEQRCPHAHIILMGVFPRGQNPNDGGRRKVAAVNEIIKSFDDGQRVTFIDISSKMIAADGTISRDMMPDFVHPTAQGYQIWADAIQPVVNKYVAVK
jgi:lysophospholipase L1-like esterase